MKVPSHIFRAYDIRGIAGEEELSAEFADQLGRAVGTYVRRGGGESVVVGRDCRLSGELLDDALCQGLRATGCRVIRIGVAPTPVGYWAIEHFRADGGVQVTGSHNPAEYNGFKLTLLGASLSGSAIAAFADAIAAQDYVRGAGGETRAPVLPAYIDALAENLEPARRPLKVVVDAGNGTGALTAVPLYRRLGYQVISLFGEPDGRFPNHHPDPSMVSELQALIRAVRDEEADLGIAFDGDADRIGVVDHQGKIVWGDRLLIPLARDVLNEVPGASVIAEVKCSQSLFEAVKQAGGRAVMCAAGHSIIKSRMKTEGALLAGEMSGHIFYAHRYYGFDDAVYAGGRLLELLSRTPEALADHLARTPELPSTPELRLPCSEDAKSGVVNAVRGYFAGIAAQRSGIRNLIDIDGVRVEWEDGWGIVRPSNTQPLLIFRFEARTTQRLAEIRDHFVDAIACAPWGLDSAMLSNYPLSA